ncbi:hypothetical protein HanPSC8_Chr09g0377821 [Helianthus annuus]|nr:hypothetical protein HanPSC8_Chr09g0377821 [Helianthus annuus]
MISDDKDDFQPFALPDFGDNLPTADGIPDEDPFFVPILVHDHLIIDLADGEHIVAPIFAPVVIPPEYWPFNDLIDVDIDLFVDGPPDDAHGNGELDEYPGLEPNFVPDDQPDVAPADPEPLPDHDPISFGLPDIAPLIPDPVPAPVDPPVVELFIPAPALADVAPFHPVESDVHRVDLPIVYLQDIPAPRLREGTSGQQPSHDPHVSAAFPHISQSAPFAPFTSSPLDEPLRWFLPYSIPTSDPYHPSHFVGYTQDVLLYSLQLRFEVMSRKVLELESIPRPLPCPCQHASVPPCSSPPPFARPPAPLTPFPEFDARFLTVEQHVRYLLCHVHKLEEELAHVLSLIFLPPPPPPSVQ